MVLFMCLRFGFVYICGDLIAPSLPVDHGPSAASTLLETRLC